MAPRRLRALAVLLSLAATMHPAAVVTVPPYHPSRLAHVADAGQMIVVTGRSSSSTYATLRTYQLANGRWTERFAAMPARVGYRGWVPAARRIQGTGTTPQGTFTITTAFGLRPNPGTRLDYRHADGNDYWVGDPHDPKTYNLFQPSANPHRTWRPSQAERLADYPTQYAHAAVIDFNRPPAATVSWNAAHHEHVTTQPADVRRGSAIFLHVNGRGSTAGCVSLALADLRRVLRWLNPAQHPRIAMAPLAEITTA